MKPIFFLLLSTVFWGCSSNDFSGESVRAGGVKKAADTSIIKADGTANNDATAGVANQGAVQTTPSTPTDQALSKSCPSGQYVSGINADGTIQCSPLPAAMSSTVTNTTVVQQVVAQPASQTVVQPAAPSCYMETTRWSYGLCKETCGNGGTQSGECTLISSSCSATYKTGQCYQGTGSRMCCK